MQSDYVTSKFAQLLAKYGLRPIRFHDLRHSCAYVHSGIGANGVKYVRASWRAAAAELANSLLYDLRAELCIKNSRNQVDSGNLR